MIQDGCTLTILLSIPFAQVPLGLLLPVFLIVLTILIASFRPQGRRTEVGAGTSCGARLRDSLVVATVLAGVWVVVGSEFLNLFKALSFWPVLAWWAVPAAILAGLCWARRERLRGLFAWPQKPPWGVWVPLTVAASAILLAGTVAVRSSPGTGDALSYHMPRQVYWMQHESVRHYPVRNTRQLAMPPMAEFAGLHLMILSGGDLYANLAQWLALTLAALTASLIARELGARALGQVMAAVLVVTNPMTWLQAGSAKNDLVAALWVLVVALWIVRIVRDGDCGPGRWFILGGAAGLAVLTKLTGAMFLAPLLGILGLWLAWKRRLVVLPLAGTVLALVLALNAGHVMRNMHAFGSPHASSLMKDTLGRSHENEVHGLSFLASNVLRNLALHAGTPSNRLNAAFEDAVKWAHVRMGRDVNDPRTSAYADIIPFRIEYRPWHEDSAGAPAHLGLTILAGCVLAAGALSSRRKDAQRRPGMSGVDRLWLAVFFAGAAGGLILFCLLAKWQPWHARLHVGIFALLAPITAAALCRGRGIGAVVVCGLLLYFLAPAVFSLNTPRPLTGPRSVLTTPRDRQILHPAQIAALDLTVQFIENVQPRTVGVHMPREYILQRRLLRDLDERPFFTHPLTPAHPPLKPWPSADLTVIMGGGKHAFFKERSSGRVMYLVAVIGAYRIFVPEETARRLHEEGVIENLPVLAGQRA